MSQVLPYQQEKDWLKPIYEERRQRSYDLGVKAIDELVKKGCKLSYELVSNYSKEIDEQHKGIHVNTLKTNKELNEYYKRNKKTYSKKMASTNVSNDTLATFKNIRTDRDLDRLKRRYMKHSKSELADMVIKLEQYIAINNDVWIKDIFEQFKE